jgi:hypothetical protein
VAWAVGTAEGTHVIVGEDEILRGLVAVQLRKVAAPFDPGIDAESRTLVILNTGIERGGGDHAACI